MAAYHLATVVACPWLMTAINRADILRLASAFLGCKPTLCSVGVRWSFPDSKSHDVTQAFHRDPDDWRFLKLFVYLTDVDGESGPHIYVAGSHNMRRPLRARTYAQEQLEAQFGKQNMRAILGARGTTFVADTSGIHAGIPPQRAPRLLLQAQYSILPNFALHYRPVADPSHHRLDSYVNRLILAPRSAESFLVDRSPRLEGADQAMRPLSPTPRGRHQTPEGERLVGTALGR